MSINTLWSYASSGINVRNTRFVYFFQRDQHARDGNQDTQQQNDEDLLSAASTKAQQENASARVTLSPQALARYADSTHNDLSGEHNDNSPYVDSANNTYTEAPFTYESLLGKNTTTAIDTVTITSTSETASLKQPQNTPTSKQTQTLDEHPSFNTIENSEQTVGIHHLPSADETEASPAVAAATANSAFNEALTQTVSETQTAFLGSTHIPNNPYAKTIPAYQMSKFNVLV